MDETSCYIFQLVPLYGYEVKDDIVDVLVENSRDKELEMYRASNEILSDELKEKVKEIESAKFQEIKDDNNDNIIMILGKLIILMVF